MPKVKPPITQETFHNAISYYLTKGYRVISQTDTTAQLLKPRHMKWYWFILLTFLIFPFPFLIIWLIFKKDNLIYLHLEELHEENVLRVINGSGRKKKFMYEPKKRHLRRAARSRFDVFFRWTIAILIIISLIIII